MNIEVPMSSQLPLPKLDVRLNILQWISVMITKYVIVDVHHEQTELTHACMLNTHDQHQVLYISNLYLFTTCILGSPNTACEVETQQVGP
jgi:hypothetical protein